MIYSERVIFSIIEEIELIKNRIFLPKDIELLLIHLRELMVKNSLLREIADFLAHPTRDEGLHCNRMQLAYNLNMIFINETNHKSSPSKIHKGSFHYLREIMYSLPIDSIKKINCKNTREGVNKLESAYEVKDDFYYLKETTNSKIIYDFVKSFISNSMEEHLLHTKTENIFTELKQAVIDFINQFEIKIDIGDSFEICRDEIIVSILLLLNDSKFKLRNDLIVNGYLSMYSHGITKRSWEPEKSPFSIAAEVGDQSYSSIIPLFISDIPAYDFIEFDEKPPDGIRIDSITYDQPYRNSKGDLKILFRKERYGYKTKKKNNVFMDASILFQQSE